MVLKLQFSIIRLETRSRIDLAHSRSARSHVYIDYGIYIYRYRKREREREGEREKEKEWERETKIDNANENAKLVRASLLSPACEPTVPLCMYICIAYGILCIAPMAHWWLCSIIEWRTYVKSGLNPRLSRLVWNVERCNRECWNKDAAILIYIWHIEKLLEYCRKLNLFCMYGTNILFINIYIPVPWFIRIINVLHRFLYIRSA